MVNSHVVMFASVALCSLFTLLFHDWWQSALYYQFFCFLAIIATGPSVTFY